MNQPAPNPYDEREQTWVKHEVLRQYLLRFAVIVGTWRDTITYVDCFSGPWENKTDNYSDTSFGIAIEELKKAKERHPHLKLRCVFIEKNPQAFAQLEKFSKTVTGIEILPLKGALEEHLDKILGFNRKGGSKNFPFIFIDPTGWTGFPMDKIVPLLQLSPGEVLINFMTSFISRFVDQQDQNYSESFDALYGQKTFRDLLLKAPETEREDLMVTLYAQEVKKRGNYQYVVHTPVFKPEINATHFHLIYASRNKKGLEVFKAGEKKAVAGLELKRADAQQRKRQSDGGLELFSSAELHDSSYYTELRAKYLEQMNGKIATAFSQQTRILYDVFWEEALSIPLIWESDLKAALTEMKKEKKITFEGFEPRQLVPKIDANNYIVKSPNTLV